jgi:Flp pilus assembly protein TadG
VYLTRPRTERGAAAVEFALVVPFLCLLLFGMITTGFTYSDHLSVTNAVREGARFGASSPYTQAAPLTVIAPADWAADVQKRVYQTYFDAGSELTQANVCVALSPQTGSDLVKVGNNCGAEPANPSNMATGSCAVKVWTHKPAHIQLVIAPTLTFNIGATSVAFYGRVAGTCTAS